MRRWPWAWLSSFVGFVLFARKVPTEKRRGQLAGTRYPRQANRGTGLGRGDPSAYGASGLMSGLQGLQNRKRCVDKPT